MKLISARQAWHDCYLDSQASPLEGVIETCQLGTRVDHGSKINTANKAVHQAQAGLIQSTIASLPVPLQVLGYWLYAPQGSYPESYEKAVWQMVAIQTGIDEQDRDEWCLVHCAIHAYRELAWGRTTLLKRPKYIAHWLQDQHGIEIDTRNFYRRLGRVHSEVLIQVDDLDRQALEPVTEVIRDRCL